MTAPVTINFIVGLQVEGGAVDVAHVRRSLEFAIQHYREAEGLTHDDDDGSVTEFQVQPEFLTLSLAQNTDPLTLTLAQRLEDLESGSTLHHYAAQAAFAVLANNWSETGAVYADDAVEAARLLTVYAQEVAALPNAIALTAHEAARLLKESERLMQMSEDAQGVYETALQNASAQARDAAQTAMRSCLEALKASPVVIPDDVESTEVAARLRDGTAPPIMLQAILRAAKASGPAVDLNNLPPVKG